MNLTTKHRENNVLLSLMYVHVFTVLVIPGITILRNFLRPGGGAVESGLTASLCAAGPWASRPDTSGTAQVFTRLTLVALASLCSAAGYFHACV